MIKKIDKCKNCQILQLKDKSNQMNRKYHQRSHKCIINIIKVLKVRIRPINENKDTHNHIKIFPIFVLNMMDLRNCLLRGVPSATY